MNKISVTLKNKINKQIKQIEDIVDFSLLTNSNNSTTFNAIKNILNELKILIKDEK